MVGLRYHIIILFNLIEIQRDFQSGTDSTNSLGSSAKKMVKCIFGHYKSR